ncbi:hypothetical protein Maq22A_c10695 [Methylobacterium aquaticum]|uniref:Uncharacterized protein n=1 Tax=Methylobacterium aquaticum TaxID=270351 RepID=A0A0C6FAF8_9HYPH|nr:hypothetical protein Maq22A_c10695 [Methylobacterium aquaticum]
MGERLGGIGERIDRVPGIRDESGDDLAEGQAGFDEDDTHRAPQGGSGRAGARPLDGNLRPACIKGDKDELIADLPGR